MDTTPGETFERFFAKQGKRVQRAGVKSLRYLWGEKALAAFKKVEKKFDLFFRAPYCRPKHGGSPRPDDGWGLPPENNQLVVPKEGRLVENKETKE